MSNFLSVENTWDIEEFYNEFQKVESEYKDRFYDVVDKTIRPQIESFEIKIIDKKIVIGLLDDILNTDVDNSPISNALFDEYKNASQNILCVINRIKYKIEEKTIDNDFSSLVDLLNTFNLKPKFYSCFGFDSILRHVREIITLHFKSASQGLTLVSIGCRELDFDYKYVVRVCKKIYDLFNFDLTIVARKGGRSILNGVINSLKSGTDGKEVERLEKYLPYAQAAYFEKQKISVQSKCFLISFLKKICAMIFGTGETYSRRIKYLTPEVITPYIKKNGVFELPLALIGYLAEEENNPNSYILAFKGTTVPLSTSAKKIKVGITNIITDILQIACGFSFAYFEAVGLLYEILQDESMKDRRLTIVGHSLGGGLAQFALAGVAKRNSSIKNIKSFGYNPAGLSSPMMQLVSNSKVDIEHLYLKYDIVTHIGFQLGKTYSQEATEWFPYNAHLIGSMHSKTQKMKEVYYQIRNFTLK